jgi:hypothetical protein
MPRACCLISCATVLYCTVLYCTVLYCTVLYCTVLYCSGDEELVVEDEWTGVLGFTLDGKPLAGAMPNAAYDGRVFVGAGYCGHGMPTCSGVGKALAQQMAAAEGHDVSAVAASDTATISEYVQSLDPGRFAQLSEVAGVEASASEQ